MKTVYISGSPRAHSNTDILLNYTKSVTGGEFVKLSTIDILPCRSCWACQKTDSCVIKDDMTEQIIPLILEADCIVLGSPVYFNNVTSTMKAFIDRTWCLRGKLRNKLGGTVVVGRKYGAEGTVTAINSFFLKHEMFPVNRGVCEFAFEKEEIEQDLQAIENAKSLGKRILEAGKLIVPQLSNSNE